MADIEVARSRIIRVRDKVEWLKAHGKFGKVWVNVHPDGVRAKRSWKRRGDRNAVGLGTYSVLILDPKLPVPTILAKWPVYVRWDENRGLTPDEAKRACGFSEDFSMAKGLSFDERWERYGRAVPPLMMRALALSVLSVLRQIDGKQDGKEARMLFDYYRPYRMAEVLAIPLNGYNVVSTFSGCGGSSLGYRMAGFKVLAALEFDKEAADTYEANFSGTPILRDDIRKVSGADLLKAAKLKPETLDVLDGSPPCSSFSTAGKRQANWGKVKEYSGQKQRTDDLFWEYARLLGEMKPRAFVAENVSGLTIGSAKGYFNEILALLRSKGYRVGCRLLDAAKLGVPQHRERVFFVGFREDLGVEPEWPRPLPRIVTIREALDGLAPPTEEEVAGAKRKFGQKGEAYLRLIKPGESASKYNVKGSWFSLSRLRWDFPSGTVQASHGNTAGCQCIHPDEDRRLTIPEVRRVCGFPEDFSTTGDFGERWERYGRAVPPLMMRALARSLGSTLSRLAA